MLLSLVGGLVACGDELPDPDEGAGEIRHPEMLGDFEHVSLARTPPSKPEEHPRLEIEELAAGEGEAIRYGEIGRFHVIGTLPSGQTFQNTYEGEPAVMRLLPPAVPEGLALGLAGTKPGGRRRVVVPPELGYGEEGDPGQRIPADAMLIYDAELEEVVDELEVGILEEGRGAELRYGDTGRFLYTGVLARDGTQFDATGRNDPTEFTISRDQVITGWALGLPGMKEGEKRRLWIPSELAYGERGNPPDIPAGADLVFDIELVGINR